MLIGGAGADDQAIYWNSTAGVTVNLTTGTGLGGEADGDTLSGIEHVAGSGLDDILTGNSEINRLDGRAGADKLYGEDGNDTLVGGAGADVLNGGAGIDTAGYENSGSGVSVDLVTGGFGGRAAGDTYVSIENVTGSNFNDVIIGDDAVNRLNGGLGADDLRGAGGNDS